MNYSEKLDAFISVCKLPSRVKGLITVDRDGNNFILINESLSDEAKMKAFRHECNHLKNNDLYSSTPAHIIESGME